jgi:dihydrolipoyl dehydrogenase
MENLTCKLLVIGGGPGGYVCAIRAAQLGVETIIIEERAYGGTCLTVGCIPSKALIHTADEFARLTSYAEGKSAMGLGAQNPSIDFAKTLAWKDGIVDRLTSGVKGLLKKAGARAIEGTATFVDGKTVRVESEDSSYEIAAENVVIATGSEPVELPFLPFGDTVIDSTGALALEKIPERMAIVGGGYIGLEIGTAFAKLGSAVTVVEAEKRVLPQYDAALTKPVLKSLADLGVTVMTETKAKGLASKGLEVEKADGSAEVVAAERILVTVGRRPRSKGAGIPDLDLTMDRGFIAIDSRCRTSMRGIYAIGDVTGEPMLAHRAMAQGEMVAEIVAGEKREWDKVAIPAVCFTDPELVTCGLSPDEAKARDIEVITGQFPFTANGRAMTTESEAGFVRIVARKKDHVVLGVQAVGQGVSELSAAFALALEMGARLEDIAGTIHAHPTQSEGVLEAALAALGHALHI